MSTDLLNSPVDHAQRVAPRVSRLLVGVIFACLVSCSVLANERTYVNEPAGIALVYDSGWIVVQQAQLKTTLESNKRKDIPLEGTSEIVPHIALSIAKSERVGELVHTANVMLMVVEFPREACAELNSKSFIDEESAEYIASWPGGRLAPQMDIAVAGARTYTVLIPLADRSVTQHRYMYCLNGNYVVLQTTSSTPVGERAVSEVLHTVQVGSLEPHPHDASSG